jgi:SAM-dependent methyltransferase
LDDDVSGDSGGNELSTTSYWDGVWAGDIRLRLPSPYIVATRNLQRLLRRYLHRGDRFLEIGCAPGKILAWAAAEVGAQVSGLDYSERGIATSRHLFSALSLPGDLRCEDLGRTSFPAAGFDVVYSSGLIEHFADPTTVVRQHLELVRPGGTAVITVPDYSGLYGTLQRYFDTEILGIHNLDIMSTTALKALVPADAGHAVRAYHFGRFSPWQLTVEKRWPAPIALAVCHAANAAALLQPMDIRALCPMIVLEVITPARDAQRAAAAVGDRPGAPAHRP